MILSILGVIYGLLLMVGRAIALAFKTVFYALRGDYGPKWRLTSAAALLVITTLIIAYFLFRGDNPPPVPPISDSYSNSIERKAESDGLKKEAEAEKKRAEDAQKEAEEFRKKANAAGRRAANARQSNTNITGPELDEKAKDY